MRVIRVLTLVVVFVLIAGACGGDADDTTTTAVTTQFPEGVEPSDGPIGMVVIRGSDDDGGRVFCGYDGDELLSPAPFDEVSHVLSDGGIEIAPYLNPDFSDSYELVGDLNVFVLTGPEPNPVEASALLIEQGIPASPHHLVMPADRWKFGPESDANEGGANLTDYMQNVFADDTNGAVAIIDTGSAPSPYPDAFAEAWSDILTGALAPIPNESEPIGLDSSFVGHGVFAAGIVRRLLPGSTVSIRSAMGVPSDGGLVLSEFSVIGNVQAAVDNEVASGGVVNLSLGTYTCDPAQIPLGFAAYIGEMAASDTDVVFVAAAGNDGVTDPDYPFWPAGFSDPALVHARVDPWLDYLSDNHPLKTGILALLNAQDPISETFAPIIVGVGALNETWSNTPGATVWAPGTDVVSTYPAGDGFATWSGTSFAAPFVSAIVAGCHGGTESGTYRESLALTIGAGPDISRPWC